MSQEPQIFRALRQQMLWPPLHAAVDVYQKRRASNADDYELIWRLIHICECTVVTLASAASSRISSLAKEAEYPKLRERCHGVAWSNDGSFDRVQGAVDGSVDKATLHIDPQYSADAFYNRSKAHWRLWRLTNKAGEIQSAIQDADEVAKRSYDHRYVSWSEFLRENSRGEIT